VFLATRRSVPGLIGATTVGTALSAVALLAFGWTRLPVAMGAMVILGFGISVCNVGINMLLQSMAPDRLRGRIVSFFTSARFGFDALGGLLAGFIASAIGPGRTMILEGWCCWASWPSWPAGGTRLVGRWRGTIQAGLRAVRPRRGHSIDRRSSYQRDVLSFQESIMTATHTVTLQRVLRAPGTHLPCLPRPRRDGQVAAAPWVPPRCMRWMRGWAANTGCPSPISRAGTATRSAAPTWSCSRGRGFPTRRL
jgi:MFS family permease